jgi:hypothetical protein
VKIFSAILHDGRKSRLAPTLLEIKNNFIRQSCRELSKEQFCRRKYVCENFCSKVIKVLGYKFFSHLWESRKIYYENGKFRSFQSLKKNFEPSSFI